MWTLPNIITLVRICFPPVIALLPILLIFQVNRLAVSKEMKL